MTIRAAGILFKAKDGRALFLKRGPTGDHQNEWCFPGGKIEGAESPLEAACREATEEVGRAPDKMPTLLTRSITEVAVPTASVDAAPGAVMPLPAPGAAEAVDFTTFLANIDETFEPVPDDEHVGFAWAPFGSPPEPLHPGCRIALDRLGMDELGVARAMAAGLLTSPQVYVNVTLWAMRITGTGVALRSAVKDKDGNVVRGEEFPWRDPALYLNDEFLARCNGLTVVWVHPKERKLNSKSYAETVVGSIFLPYIKGNEVWGIAKVYDDHANKALAEEDLSTSPGVILSDPASPSYKFTTEEGDVILIEGKPSLVDHIALCEKGVWDKGGDATGIDRGDDIYTDSVDGAKLESILYKTRDMKMNKLIRMAEQAS